MKFILGKKIGMTTIYDKEKGALDVTLIECPVNKISLLRTSDKDGYRAVRLEIPKTKNLKYNKEFRVVDEKSEYKKGDSISVEIFKAGDKVKVSGISKGKGFQGVMKRHGFKGSSHSHGHKHDWRAPGSIGSSFPEHVVKGKRMAGRMGGKRITTKNLKIVSVDKEKSLIAIKGSIPGINKGIVEIVSE